MRDKSPTVDRSREMEEGAWWDLWNTSYRVKDKNDEVSNELFQRAAEAIDGISGDGKRRILEVACGTGILSRMIAYSRYHGLDLSAAAIEVARAKSSDNSPPAGASIPIYEAADFNEWPLPSGEFELVICIDAIPNFRDQLSAMKKMAQALRPGGHLVLTTVNRFVYQRIRRTGGVKLESGPVNRWLSRRELHSLMYQSGFVIAKSCTIMPRGNMGYLRILNSPRLNGLLGPQVESLLKRMKERIGLGQYSLVIARKEN
jgi:2-polyprenyl-3-methyl-5-hydroxy-6-metoxy-1,4-benzoquinol methylase